jgi:thiol-disulfide isomerase/thioredoxin
MQVGLILAALCGVAAASVPAADIIAGVRAAVDRRDFAAAERDLAAYRAQRGVTPEWLEAYSWLGRGALAAGSLDKAASAAGETRRLSLGLLKGRTLDAERHLPIAMGAAIEVYAQALAQRGERAEAVAFLEQQLAGFGGSSIRARIQKNLNLLSLEGKPAPALALEPWTGVRPAPLSAFKGRPVLLFFWAHWCGDCKALAPDLAKLKARYKDLAIVAPTQCYGYVAGGAEAPPEREVPYIDQVWSRFYAGLGEAPLPLNPENLRNYGASTVPTLVLLDRDGIVRLYHPGGMPYSELSARMDALAR